MGLRQPEGQHLRILNILIIYLAVLFACDSPGTNKHPSEMATPIPVHTRVWSAHGASTTMEVRVRDEEVQKRQQELKGVWRQHNRYPPEITIWLFFYYFSGSWTKIMVLCYMCASSFCCLSCPLQVLPWDLTGLASLKSRLDENARQLPPTRTDGTWQTRKVFVVYKFMILLMMCIKDFPTCMISSKILQSFHQSQIYRTPNSQTMYSMWPTTLIISNIQNSKDARWWFWCDNG